MSAAVKNQKWVLVAKPATESHQAETDEEFELAESLLILGQSLSSRDSEGCLGKSMPNDLLATLIEITFLVCANESRLVR